MLQKESNKINHWESGIARYHFEQDVLISQSFPVQRTVENLTSNAELIRSITNNKPTKVLVILCKSPVPDKAARNLSARLVPELYSAMAMVSKPGLAQFVMRMVFAFSNPGIPIKIFSNQQDALKWLTDIK
jgi:hypothetical protein